MTTPKLLTPLIAGALCAALVIPIRKMMAGAESEKA